MADGAMASKSETGKASESEESAASFGKGVYLGPDCTHATVRKRIFAMEAAGVDLTGFTFRREKSNADYVPDWNNIELGVTVDANYLKRIPALLKALWVLVKNGGTLRKARYIYARNFDLIFIAMVAKLLTFSGAKLVYEVPDIQEFFFGETPRAKVFRFLERIVLSRISLLVASSPGFITGYFEPVQGYKGKYFVWENKLLADQLPPLPGREALDANLPKPTPWILSWHGTLRCPESMKLLSEIARRLGDRIQIYMRGKPTNYPELFEESFAGLDNVVFEGEYSLPDDLEEIYARAHFSWCIDYFDAEGNSPLLLPNRVYQGGYLGNVPIGVEGHETGDYIARNDIGFRLKQPLVESVVAFFEAMTWETYMEARDKVFAKRDTLFIETAGDVQKLLDAIAES